MISTTTIHVLEMRNQAQWVSDLPKFIKVISVGMGFKVNQFEGLKTRLNWISGPIFLEATTGWSGAQASYTLWSLDMQDVCQITYHKC